MSIDEKKHQFAPIGAGHYPGLAFPKLAAAANKIVAFVTG
jgi:hypothetical protein